MRDTSENPNTLWSNAVPGYKKPWWELQLCQTPTCWGLGLEYSQDAEDWIEMPWWAVNLQVGPWNLTLQRAEFKK